MKIAVNRLGGNDPNGPVRFIEWETGPWWTSATGNETRSQTGDITIPYCADLFRYEFLGTADTWRGRVIKAFMWLMDFWPLRRGR